MNKPRIIFATTMLVLSFASYLPIYSQVAQTKNVNSAPTKKDNSRSIATSLGDSSSKQTGFIGIFNPNAGLLMTPLIPMGAIGDVVDFSLGSFHVFGDVRVPTKYLNKIKLPINKFNLY